MISRRFNYYRIILPVSLGIAALFVPLLRDFHIESAIVATAAGTLWGGWRGCHRPKGSTGDFGAALRLTGYLFLFGLPLLLNAIINGCFSVHGMGFWLLLPVPGVFLGYAMGRLFRFWGLPYRKTLTMALLVAIAAGGLIAEFLNFPQVYFFNHVWGYWPGPIYDETVKLTESVFAFRGLTLCWVLLIWSIPSLNEEKTSRWIAALSAIILMTGYTRLAESGIISPPRHLQERLGSSMETEHFRIFYDDRYYTDEEIALIALEQEFYLQQISSRLNLSGLSSGVESYLYGHPWQKKKMVGAKFTSYVPVWLEQDQLHIAKQQIDGSLKHELVHVLSKQFGNRLFNASTSIGLVEGLAVALAPAGSGKTTIDQIVASEKPLPSAGEMKGALSPLGFYGGRSAVNYTTTGSFVKYLLDHYPVGSFKEAYRSGDVGGSYSESFEKLVEGWRQSLDTVRVDSVDRGIAERLFAMPSLFEQECPHIMSDFGEALDRYRFYLAEHDTVRALGHIDEAMKIRPGNLFVKSEWAFRHLKEGRAGEVRSNAALSDTSADLQLLYADGYALGDNETMAKAHLGRALQLVAGEKSAGGLEEALATRLDSTQWRYYLDLTYRKGLFDAATFKNLYYRTKVRAVREVLKREGRDLLVAYASQLFTIPADMEYFDIFIQMIHRLAYYEEFEWAGKWIEKIESVPGLRARYTVRLQQEKQWLNYLQNGPTE